MIDLILLVVVKLLCGWLIADLAGGVLHWLQERVLTPSTPWLGRWIVLPNRRHHADPRSFAATLVARNAATWIVAAILSAIWLALLGPSWIWASAIAGGMLSSIVHYRAHHRPPSDRAFCVLTDWLNPVLDRAGVWPLLDRLVPLAKA